MKHGLKDELHKWIIQKRWCNFPDSYRRLPFDGSRDLLLMILRELKHNNASSTLSNIVYCVTTNPWFTTEMKNAVGGQFTVSVVEKFLSKFPTLVLLDGCPVQAFLKDNCLQWLYFPGKKIFTASKSPPETQCNTLLYFRNRILNEIKNECLKWLSFVMLSSFVDSAPDQVKTCVGEMQACWLPWLLNHPCIFQFDANHRLFTLRETVISDFDEPSVSMFHKDYYVLMYIKGLIERKKCSLSLDNLFKLYWLFVIAPKNRDRYHSQHLPIYTHDEFVEFVRVNGESFFTISESVISVRHPLPVVFISGIYPYDGCENEYIGHGKVKQVSDSYAIIDVGRNCSEDVYFDKNLFKSEIKPLNSCIKIGDWFSFSAVQVEGLKCVDIKQNSKWKATSLWTAIMTFKQLEQSFNINEKDTSTSDIVNRDSLLDISKVRSIANSANKTESTQVVISNFEKEPNNKPLTHQEVIKILSDDESQDSNENTDEEMVHIEKSVDTSDNMDETSKPSQGSKDSQIDNITIPTEKGLSSDHNKESKYEAMNTEDSVTDNSNENKSSESLDQCKIVDKTEDDMSMVTDVHNNVIEGNQVMVNKNNNLTSKMEEKSLNSHLIVKVNSGVDENEMSESLELCKVVDNTKDDLPMVSETCSSSSEEKKKKILTTKIEQKSSHTCSNNPSTDDTDYVMSDFMAQEIKQSNSLVVKEQSEGVQLITKNNLIVESDSNSKENKISENTDLSKIIEKIDTDSTVTCEISIPVMNDDEMVEKVERNSAIVFGPIKQAVDQGTQTIISGEIVAKEDLPLSVIKSLFS